MKNSDAFYNSFAAFYPVADIFLMPRKKKLIREVNTMAPGKLLEVGLGNGSHLDLYQGHEITGIDSSEAMLARAKNRNSQVTLYKMDAHSLSFSDGSFDYVVLSHVIGVTRDPEKVLSEVLRILKPGGCLFILNHFTPPNWLRYLDHSVQPLSALLKIRSVFHLDSLGTLNKFQLKKRVFLDPWSYFNLLIYQKP